MTSDIVSVGFSANIGPVVARPAGPVLPATYVLSLLQSVQRSNTCSNQHSSLTACSKRISAAVGGNNLRLESLVPYPNLSPIVFIVGGTK